MFYFFMDIIEKLVVYLFVVKDIEALQPVNNKIIVCMCLQGCKGIWQWPIY